MGVGPHLVPPEAGRRTGHSPRFSEILITISFSESAEQRHKVDVVVISFGVAMQHRPFPFGEGIRGMRPNDDPPRRTQQAMIREQNVGNILLR